MTNIEVIIVSLLLLEEENRDYRTSVTIIENELFNIGNEDMFDQYATNEGILLIYSQLLEKVRDQLDSRPTSIRTKATISAAFELLWTHILTLCKINRISIDKPMNTKLY
ncbi:hypothetical protein D3C76_1082420 [compost metagenome]